MYLSLSDWRGRKSETRATAPPFKLAPVILALGVTSLLTDISSESVAAVLPLYITASLGLSTIAYGFVDGIYQGISSSVRIAAGWTADRTGSQKWIAFAGYGLSALARMALLVADGFGSLAAVIAVDRVGKGIRTAPRDALIRFAAQPEHIGRSFGVHRMLDTVGAALGPVLAFVILLVIPNGYRVVFIASLAFAVIGVAVLGLFVPNERRRHPATAREPRPGWRDVNTPAMRRLLLVAGALGLLTVGDGFLYLVLQSRTSFAAEWFPLLYVGTNVAYLLLAIPMGRLADRWGRTRVFIAGHGALLAAYVSAVLPWAGLPATLATLALLGAFYAATDGVLAALAGLLSPQRAAASGIAAAQTVVAVARLISSTGFGLLWYAVGGAPALWIMAAGLVLVLPLAVLLLRAAQGAGVQTAAQSVP
ncbi:MFS transporter [Sinomonas sp. ASV322]|uniref:MFS transporter n=1 Tax=Sinomonas sp. ASV322 TaxID=3041920 RepID=UPI0027DE7102|nr:MFS transporter [Sinomonas sp. ASV322]MDQ4503530.1 MFS transporter [Sinomonas sp. ASV322]